MLVYTFREYSDNKDFFTIWFGTQSNHIKWNYIRALINPDPRRIANYPPLLYILARASHPHK